jgi:transcriptional regulator with XRE-family HTH domain
MKLKVGDKLRNIREESKRSQEEMAMLLHMELPLYIRYEQNKIDMDMTTITEVGILLGLPIEDLIVDTFQMKSTNHGNGQASMVMGNYSYYGVEGPPKQKRETKDLQKEYEYLKEALDNIKREFEELKSQLKK